MRAISTVVDVSICLLLIAASIAMVTLPVQTSPTVAVDETAAVIAASTAAVDFDHPFVSQAPNGTPAAGHTGDASGSIATHLGWAALSNLTVDGHRIRFGASDYRAAVERRVQRIRGWVTDPIRVDAVWSPYQGAPVSGRIGSGPVPPPESSVALARLRVPGRIGGINASATGSYDHLAHRISRQTVDGLFPARRFRIALQGIGPGRHAVQARYQSMAIGLDIGLGSALQHAQTAAANKELTGALATRLARDMRDRFQTPAAAGRAVETGTVLVTIRGWPR